MLLIVVTIFLLVLLDRMYLRLLRTSVVFLSGMELPAVSGGFFFWFRSRVSFTGKSLDLKLIASYSLFAVIFGHEKEPFLGFIC